MSDFRSAVGQTISWESTAIPGFSNFEFVERRYAAHPVLRRVLSQARRHGYRSLLVENIQESDCSLLAEENAALQQRCSDYERSEVHRLSFFSSPPDVAPQPQEFIGCAILKRDYFKGDSLPHSHIYEAIIKPYRTTEQNNFIHTERAYDINTAAGSFQTRGVLYAQQNGRTFVCAHVALRTALSCLVPEGDVSYARMNQLAGVDHASGTVGEGGGLRPDQVESVLAGYGIAFDKLVHEPNGTDPVPLPDDVEYQRDIYAAIESRCPALIGFELSAHAGSAAAPPRHVIASFGHTFNDDAWMPEAQRFYFGGQNSFFPSEAWLSSYVVHDDNTGPYACLPRHYLRRDNFRLLYALKRHPSALSPTLAEGLALSSLRNLVRVVPHLGAEWFDRFAAHARANLLVLRAFLVNKRAYIDHVTTLSDQHGDRFPVQDLGLLDTLLPEQIWLIEVSAPELFPISRKKFGEVLLDPDQLPPLTGGVRPLAMRLPGLLITGLDVRLNDLRGYTPLFTSQPAA